MRTPRVQTIGTPRDSTNGYCENAKRSCRTSDALSPVHLALPPSTTNGTGICSQQVYTTQVTKGEGGGETVGKNVRTARPDFAHLFNSATPAPPCPIHTNFIPAFTSLIFPSMHPALSESYLLLQACSPPLLWRLVRSHQSGRQQDKGESTKTKSLHYAATGCGGQHPTAGGRGAASLLSCSALPQGTPGVGHPKLREGSWEVSMG